MALPIICFPGSTRERVGTPFSSLAKNNLSGGMGYGSFGVFPIGH
jgi:hypothetical protein